MRIIKVISQILLSLGLIGGCMYFLYEMYVATIINLDKVDSNIIVALIAGTITVLGYFITRYLERKKIIEQEIRQQKLPIYEEFISFIFKVLMSSKTKEKFSEQELELFFIDFNKKAIIWLSDSSLKAYIDWRNKLSNIRESSDQKADASDSLYEFEKLLLAFRKDIGHKNSSLNKGDILSTFVNDLKKNK